jgi:hypothetical protein
VQQISNLNTETRLLSDSERKLLYRLKMALWFITILFILHALPAAVFPEAYPLTRWAMFSEANTGFHVLQEGYLGRHWLRAVDASGAVYTVKQEELYQGIPISSAYVNIARLAMFNASLPDEELVENPANVVERAQARQAIFDRLDRKFGVEFISFEVIRDYIEIDYTRYPYVDFTQPAHTEVLAFIEKADLSANGGTN